jgi:putative PIN family toxin of toxin-antitoxin system
VGRLRAFIDSNTLVSAIVFDAAELKVIVLLKKKGHELVISEHIVEEILRVMIEKFPEHSSLFLEFLKLSGIEIVPKIDYQDIIDDFNMVRDKHDQHVLAAAVASRCQIIVTGDKDLLVLKKCRGIRILRTKETVAAL